MTLPPTRIGASGVAGVAVRGGGGAEGAEVPAAMPAAPGPAAPPVVCPVEGRGDAAADVAVCAAAGACPAPAAAVPAEAGDPVAGSQRIDCTNTGADGPVVAKRGDSLDVTADGGKTSRRSDGPFIVAVVRRPFVVETMTSWNDSGPSAGGWYWRSRADWRAYVIKSSAARAMASSGANICSADGSGSSWTTLCVDGFGPDSAM